MLFTSDYTMNINKTLSLLDEAQVCHTGIIINTGYWLAYYLATHANKEVTSK